MSPRRLRTALLRTYSPAFRARYGSEMLDALDADDAGQSRRHRVANDLDLARNGIAQRFGSDVVADIEDGARWIGLAALTLCICWSTVSLTSSIRWSGLTPINFRIALLWSAVLLAAVGRLLLPRRGAHIVWFMGLSIAIWSTVLGYIERNQPHSEISLGTVSTVLRWQTASVAVLLLLGAAAPVHRLRTNGVAAAVGLIAGALLTVRFASIASFSTSSVFTVDGPVSAYATPAMVLPSSTNWVIPGTFVDLSRVDLIPNFGWWWLVGLLAVASLGPFRSKAAVVAMAIAGITIATTLTSDALRSLPAAARIVLPAVVIAECAIVLAVSWRSRSRWNSVP